jgi:hypothetical protein
MRFDERNPNADIYAGSAYKILNCNFVLHFKLANKISPVSVTVQGEEYAIQN